MKNLKTILMTMGVIIGFTVADKCFAQIANPTNAYGDGVNIPLKQVDIINGQAVYAIYSGDINQDGTVDGQDANYIDNDASNFAFGYNPSDLNGDGGTDGQDANYVDNNSQLFLFKATP